MSLKNNTSSSFNAILLFFLISNTQLGVTAMSFQYPINKVAGHDGWISVAIAGLIVILIVTVMLSTLKKYGNKDLYAIHEDLYGKWLGKFVNFIFSVYFMIVSFTVIRNYLEVINTWLFPEFPTWLFNLLCGLLLIYLVTGGIRVVVGFALLAFLTSTWILVLDFTPLRSAQWSYLLPIMQATPHEIFQGVTKMAFPLLGYEMVYILYPFIKDKQKVPKYTYFSQLFTTIYYVFLMISASVYYAEEQLKQIVWPTIHWFQTVSFPFIERLEIIAVAFWFIIILPNTTIYLWSATRGFKIIFGIKQKYALYVCIGLMLASSVFLQKRIDLYLFTEWVGNVGVALCMAYPIFLYLLVQFKHRIKGETRK